ncbi:PaaI family thioesterase [Luteococcus peritonei]|uniref:PaaI family thioesterase n=1 Tax=Luteococcus peritonei TaxID=88874 RepID=A0ABW4RQX2_9ACTN
MLWETNPDLPEWATGMSSALDEKMGLEMLELSPERVSGRVPVEGNTQVAGIWHGGASAVMVESLGSMGAYAHARGFGRIAVGLDISVTHHRVTRTGWVTGVATPLQLGRSICSYQVELTDDEGHRVATGRLTCMLIDPPKSP